MNNNLEYGQVKISSDVITSIVAIAVEETDGFNIVKTFVDKVTNKNQAIKISVDESEVLDITVDVNIEYGLKIYESVPKVQENIISNIEIMTGLKVNTININVNSLYFK